jgi:iron complex outermembrane recepter protein
MRNLVKMTLSLLLTAAFGGFAAAQTTAAGQETATDQQGSATEAREADQPQEANPAQATTGTDESAEQVAEPIRRTEEVVVVGLRRSLENSLEVKQLSPLVVEALDLADIDAIPDVTIADAIIRLPGVNGARDRGNQSQAAIRGLGPRMVFGTVNGREVASSEPGRAIRFEQYPSELVSSVQIYKTQSTDLIAGGIAGSVNLETTSPLSFDGPEFSFRVGAIEYDGGKDIPDYGTLGGRFSGSWTKKFSERFGLALGVASQRQKNAYPSYQAWGFNTGGTWQDNLPAGGGDLTGNGDFGYVPWGVQTEVKKLTTDRNAGLAVLEFWPSNTLKIKVDGLYTEYKIDEQQNQTWYQGIGNWDNGQAGMYSDATIVGTRAIAITADEWTGNIRNVLAAYNQKNSVLSTGLNLDYSGLASWKVTADLAYSKAKRDNFWNALYLDDFGNPFSYDLRDEPSVTVPADSSAASPETAELGINDWNEGSVLDDDLLSARLDLSKQLGGTLSGITFGVRASTRDKKTIWEAYTWTESEGLLWDWSNPNPAQFPAGFLSSYTLGSLTTGPFLNAPSYEAAVGALTGGRTDFSSMGSISAAEGSWPSWQVKERDLAGYFKLDFVGSLGSVEYNANAGLRLEDIETKSYEIRPDGSAGDSVDNSYTQLLPSANINFNFDKGRILRIGLARAISRPPLDELRAGQYISAVEESREGNTGNPYLDPFTSDQIDVAYEWYFSKESLLALALYYKHINNYVGYTSFDVATDTGTAVTVWAPKNGEGGHIQGAELTFQMPFTSHVGIYSNYAFADTDITEFAPEGNPYPMAGVAKHTATVDLWLSNKTFEARLGYKYHSGYTTGFEWTGSSLRYLDSEQNLGLNLAYHFNKNLSLRVQSNNLTNEPLRLTQNNDDLDVRRYDVYGRTFLADVTLKLR